MHVLVSEICKKTTGEREALLVTREIGRRLRAEVAARMMETADWEIVTLDFSGVGVIDYSCADEFLAKLITRLIAGEYAEKYLCLANLSTAQRENIEVALERKRLPVIVLNPDDTWQCLGTIKPYLSQTLDLVMAREKISARELSGLLHLELNTSSTRLINLHRQRLVTRQERFIAEGGREYVYLGLANRNPARMSDG